MVTFFLNFFICDTPIKKRERDTSKQKTTSHSDLLYFLRFADKKKERGTHPCKKQYPMVTFTCKNKYDYHLVIYIFTYFKFVLILWCIYKKCQLECQLIDILMYLFMLNLSLGNFDVYIRHSIKKNRLYQYFFSQYDHTREFSTHSMCVI